MLRCYYILPLLLPLYSCPCCHCCCTSRDGWSPAMSCRRSHAPHPRVVGQPGRSGCRQRVKATDWVASTERRSTCVTSRTAPTPCTTAVFIRRACSTRLKSSSTAAADCMHWIISSRRFIVNAARRVEETSWYSDNRLLSPPTRRCCLLRGLTISNPTVIPWDGRLGRCNAAYTSSI